MVSPGLAGNGHRRVTEAVLAHLIKRYLDTIPNAFVLGITGIKGFQPLLGKGLIVTTYDYRKK